MEVFGSAVIKFKKKQGSFNTCMHKEREVRLETSTAACDSASWRKIGLGGCEACGYLLDPTVVHLPAGVECVRRFRQLQVA